MSEVLSARAVSKRFGERMALHDVSFTTRRGELVALIGANGAGKTTLLSLLAGVQRPSQGTVAASGTVGWVPQTPAVYGRLTVAENLALFARLERVADPAAAVKRMLTQTDLAARADEQLRRLSGGNRQRVNVAVGMLAQPPVLLLDEPSEALDPLQRERLWEFVRGLCGQGTCVIFSTHNVAEAQRHSDRVLALHEGELLLDGPPTAIAPAGADFEAAFVAFLRERQEG